MAKRNTYPTIYTYIHTYKNTHKKKKLSKKLKSYKPRYLTELTNVFYTARFIVCRLKWIDNKPCRLPMAISLWDQAWQEK